MTRFALKGLLGRKLRSVLTAIAIVLGVAMVCGTFVLTDSIDQAFDSIFNDVREGSNAVITGKSAVDLSDENAAAQPAFDESLLEEVRALPSVSAAEGGVDSESTLLIDRDGDAIVSGGAPPLGFSIANPDSPFNPLTLVEGAWPGPNEIVIDEGTADDEDFAVGDTIGVQAEGPVRRLRISGIIRFGSVSSIGGATLAGFDLPTAQELFGKEGKLDEIAIASTPGTSDEQLVSDLEAVIPPTTQVQTGAEQASEDAEGVNEFISFLRGFLLAFAGISLFVGSFVIANSLAITIAQRTREFATVRTIGGSRRQILVSIVIEALVLGAAASVVGLVLGLALAEGLFSLFDAVGFTLPNSGLVFEPRTAIVALLVGILVTLVASLRPAIRATRVPPIAAVREGAVLPRSKLARYRTAGTVLLTALGFGALVYGLFGPGLGTTGVLLWMGLGALLIFFGVALFSARIASPLAALVSPVGKWVVVALSILVWPFWTLPFWLLRYGFFGPGPSGHRVGAAIGGGLLNPLLLVVVLVMKLRALVFRRWRPEWPQEFPGVLPDKTMSRVGTQNTQRNPERTASTAAALMIGLALVTLVATLAAGITATFRDAVNELWGGADYAITAQNNFSPIPIAAAEAAADAPGVEAVGSVRVGDALAFGSTIFATAVDPETATIFTIDWAEGSDEVLAELGDDGAFVDDGYAEDHDLTLGSPVELTFANGDREQYSIEGIFDPPAGGSPFGAITISAAEWDRHTEAPRNLYSFVRMEGGQTDANAAALERQLADFPNAKSQTREEFIDNQIAGLSAVLNILYVLLALSVVVSLFGIVNTLVLTVFERTRELGMLRAVGMTQRQTRRMIRHESVITALIGGTLGIALGVVLAGLLVARVEFVDFSLPVLQIVIFAIAAIVVGVVAAIFPARRAARLNVLEALQYE